MGEEAQRQASRAPMPCVEMRLKRLDEVPDDLQSETDSVIVTRLLACRVDGGDSSSGMHLPLDSTWLRPGGRE